MTVVSLVERQQNCAAPQAIATKFSSLSYERPDGLYDSGRDDSYLIAFLTISFVAIRISCKVSQCRAVDPRPCQFFTCSV